MRTFLSSNAVLRPVLLTALLGLAACGATPINDDVSRLERNDLIASSTEALSAPTQRDLQRQAKNATFQELLNAEAEALMVTSDLGSNLSFEFDVQSFMIPDEMQTKITGARAFLSTRVTLKTATGDMLVEGAEMTFVAPADGQAVMDADALVLAFSEHFQSSLQGR